MTLAKNLFSSNTKIHLKSFKPQENYKSIGKQFNIDTRVPEYNSMHLRIDRNNLKTLQISKKFE